MAAAARVVTASRWTAAGNWPINRMAGTSSTLPHVHGTRSPAWLTSISTDWPQVQGSKYFIAGSFQWAGPLAGSGHSQRVAGSGSPQLNPFWGSLRHPPTRAD